jgi:hypothetical protein
MAAAPLRSTFVCALALVAGCLHNPKKPASDPDDGGSGQSDAIAIVVPDARADLFTAPDARQDLAADVEIETPPDGSVPDTLAADTLPPDSLAPDMNSCTPACTEGAKRCGPGGGLQTCAAVAGCPAWGAESSCGANATCGGSEPAAACTCKPAPAACNGAAGTFCQDATHVGTCAKDSFGCVFTAAGNTACPGGQLCGGTAPNGACGCSNTCSAAQVGTYCIDSKTVATCTASNGCFASSNAITCPGHQTCSGAAGAGACKCPAAALTEGAGCATAGLTTCDGTTLLTCTAEAGSGCKLWVKSTDCATAAGGPFQCGTRGGAAACQCPDPSTTIVYVDPVAGHDTAAVVPNGANTPAACRYKSITKALTAVTSTRRRVVATTASPPATFSDETFPLALAANVTLDTVDATPTPSNYTIAFDSATATSAITMADGSTLEGFTVTAASGNANASVISCSAGAVTVRGSVLVGASNGGAGAKPATGIAINAGNTDACTGTLTNLIVRNFRTGVAVTTTSNTPVTLSDSTLRDNGIATTAGAGLLIASGKVTVTRLTINKSATGTASWGVVLDPGSPTVAATLTATDLAVATLTRAALELRAAGGMAAPTATLTAGDLDAGNAADPGVRQQAGTLVLNGTNIHGANTDGLLIEGGTATVGPGSKLESNGRDGVRALAGTVTIGAAGMTAVSIASNTGVGVALLGDSGNLTATLKSASIHDNHDQGLLIRQGATFTTSATIDGNDIFANNGTAGRAVGGVFFATSSTLTSFTANKVHGNVGDEVGFDAPPNGGDTWDLAPAVACAAPNLIYCYNPAGGGTSVGLHILDTAPMTTKVNAAGAVSWSNLIPLKGTDFEFDMTKHDVTTAPACAPFVAICN